MSTIPGSIFHKEVYSKIGPFKENVRAGEDIEWANRIHANKKIRSSFLKEPSLEYSSISTSLISELKRSHRNLWSAAKIDAQQNTRMLVLGLISISLLMLTPSWNKFFGGLLYIPNITKITASFIFTAYYIARSFLLPIQKGLKIINLIPISHFQIFILSFALDVVKIAAFFNSAFVRTFQRL